MLATTTLFCTALSVFILWGILSYTFAGLIAYGIVYGCLATGYSSLWTGFVKPIASTPPSLLVHTTLTGYKLSSRGRSYPHHDYLWFPDALTGYRQHSLDANLYRLAA